jgi:1-phosphofructokinase family hexose kinase
VPVDTYAGLMADAAQLGVTTILDCDGEALRHGLQGKPSLIKPNAEEAAELLGRPLPDLPAVVDAARELRRHGPETVIISMGEQGSVCATGERVLHVRPPAVERRSTVGSGDSLVAGIAVALSAGDPIEEGLRTGTAAGAATAMTPGTQLGSAEEIARQRDAVRIETLA